MDEFEVRITEFEHAVEEVGRAADLIGLKHRRERRDEARSRLRQYVSDAILRERSSLRDHFAGRVLAGLCAVPGVLEPASVERVPEVAYLLADAMLAAITEGYGGMYDDVPSALEEIAYGLEGVGANVYVATLRLAATRLRDAVREVSP